MAIKLGYYKAHLWTWTNSIQEFNAVSQNLILSIFFKKKTFKKNIV
jgi:hypothetical protein